MDGAVAMLDKIVCAKVNGVIIWSSSNGFITPEKHQSQNDRILATSKYKGIKILEIFHNGKIIYLYKRGDKSINISSNYQNVKDKIKKFKNE